MNNPRLLTTKPAIFFLLVSIFSLASFKNTNAQSIFNANYADFNFLAANKIHKVGADGSAVGNVTLYTNIITISGQQIDCIVRTVSLSGGTFTLPGSPGAGTIPFDYSSATGAGMSANADRFFSPTFNWTTVGSCRFRFEFILGGSYNNGTNTGTAVILQNVYVNTYDIDGNGSANSNQNNEFGGFNTAQYKTGTGSNLVPSYNAINGLTRFRSSTTTNTSSIIDDANRLKVGYAELSTIEILVGADGGGAAYYFLDFGQGPAWTVTPAVLTSPVLDLNTSTTGTGNTTIACTAMRNFTSGTTNISGSSNAIDEIEIFIQASGILDGNSEVLIPKIPATTTDSIKLGTPFSGAQSISISSVTYNVTRSTGGGTDTIRIKPVSGTFTTAQVETFLDSLRYVNIKPLPTTGIRSFTLTMRESFIKSVPANFQINVDCTLLPVNWISFSATKQSNHTVNLNWNIAQEINTKEYVIQHSNDATAWNAIGLVAAAGNGNSVTAYTYTHATPINGNNYYRVLQRDIDGKSSFSNVALVSFLSPTASMQVLNRPVTDGNLRLQLPAPAPAMVSIFANNGQLLLQQKLNSGIQNINVSNYPGGLYFIRSGTSTGKFVIE